MFRIISCLNETIKDVKQCNIKINTLCGSEAVCGLFLFWSDGLIFLACVLVIGHFH